MLPVSDGSLVNATPVTRRFTYVVRLRAFSNVGIHQLRTFPGLAAPQQKVAERSPRWLLVSKRPRRLDAQPAGPYIPGGKIGSLSVTIIWLR